MLNLMYITNRPEIAQIAEAGGVDRIFVDLEYIGKAERQAGMDTVKSKHTLEDVKRIADSVSVAEVLVRINPIHEATEAYCSSEEEINTAIENGAQVLMLPFFKTLQEVQQFLQYVNGRVQTMLLVETPEAVAIIDEILELPEIDFVHIGINDLSLGYGKSFMFELLADGTVEMLCKKFEKKGIPYGFGGIALLGKGVIPAEMIICEHYRLGSSCAILSRSFCDVDKIDNLGIVSSIFLNGVRQIREFEKECDDRLSYFTKNKNKLKKMVEGIVAREEL